MTGKSRRQPVKPTRRGRRWVTALLSIAVTVLLVVFGAQLANGPSENNDVAASTLVTPANKPATAVANAATPVTTPPATTPVATATPTLAAVTATPSPTPPSIPAITAGASPLATSAIEQFARQNDTTLGLGTATSSAFTSAATGVVGQYFANAVLEYHPEFVGTPYVVELSRIGVALAGVNGLQHSAPFQPLSSSTQGDANCWFIQATDHRLCGGFRDDWRTHGLDFGDPGVSYRESLALFGYPISEEFTDPASGRTVQYFERGVLTYDGNKPPTDRIQTQTSTAAVLERWQFQIISNATALPGGG